MRQRSMHVILDRHGVLSPLNVPVVLGRVPRDGQRIAGSYVKTTFPDLKDLVDNSLNA